MDESLNRWFASYDEAAASRKKFGGYLLPFRRQFVVVESAAIRALGLDPDDPDWDAIGWDLVNPADQLAAGRLTEKRTAIRKKAHEQ